MKIESFFPPQRKLMGPGPSDLHPRVSQALSRPILGHLDPLFIKMMDELKEMLQRAYCTKNPFTLPISAPGSAGMEFCLVNLLERGDKAIVCKNGVFGLRLEQNIIRAGAEAIAIEDAWGSPVDVNKVEEVLQKHSDAKLLCFVHAETSTGARSDAKEIAKLAQKHGVLVVADCVTSLGGIELKVDDWGIDAAYSGSQKCLSVPPGLSPVTMSERALEVIKNRKTKVQSWFLDVNLLAGYWAQTSGQPSRSYHHTAPVNSLYGLHEGLVLLHQEGLENSHNRHHNLHLKLLEGLEKLGLTMYVEKDFRLPQLNSVKIPDGVDEAKIRKNLLQKYQLEIGAGLGDLAGKVWRIGLMGYSAREENVLYCLAALEQELKQN